MRDDGGCMPRPACVSPLRRRARCISAPPWWRSPTPSRRGRSAASCCCASTTRTRSGRSRAPSRGSSTTSPGSAWSSPGTPVRQSERRGAARRRRRASCSRRRMRIAASARPRRSATTGAAGRCRAPTPSGATRPASRTSSASACRPPMSSWTTRRAGRCASPADEISDFVLVRADGRPTFDLATAVDDRDLAITHIVRGEDHLANSARHLLLLRALGAVEPVVRALPDHRRRRRRAALDAPRRRAARLAARSAASRPRPWSRTPLSSPAPRRAAPSEVASLAELAQRFSLARLGRGTAHADPAHLAWLGREVLAGLPLRGAGPAAGARSSRTGRPTCVLEALAEAARGASALGEVADSAALLAQSAGRPTAGLAGARAVLRPARGGRARAHALRGGRRADRQAARARPGRGLSPRDVLHPLRIGPHGPVARPAAAGRGRGACRVRRPSSGAADDMTRQTLRLYDRLRDASVEVEPSTPGVAARLQLRPDGLRAHPRGQRAAVLDGDGAQARVRAAARPAGAPGHQHHRHQRQDLRRSGRGRRSVGAAGERDGRGLPNRHRRARASGGPTRSRSRARRSRRSSR